MIENSKATCTCVFCGRKRTYSTWTDDGRDYMGHARGSVESGNDDTGCNCTFGKLEHNEQKTEIKRMCMNCNYMKSCKCTNEKTLKSISEQFDVGKELTIKDIRKVCNNHSLDMNIFKDIIK